MPTMRRFAPIRTCLAGLFGLSTLGARAECLRYTVTICSGSCTANVTALNDLSDVVGWHSCAGGENRAFVAWNAGPVISLVLPNQFDSRAYDINVNQKIVGVVALNDVGSTRAFLYENGQMINLGTLGGNWSEAYGVNDAGVSVGYASVNGSTNHAFRWEAGVMTDLNLPIGPTHNANDINNAGFIVGWMGINPSPFFTAEAFLWDDGKTTPLGIPAGGTYSTAEAISNNGAICGWYGFPGPNPFGGDSIRHALAWIDGEMIDLGVLPGFLESTAYGINDYHMFVGRCWNNFPATSKAFIWRDGMMMALNDLLGPEFIQYTIDSPRAINSSRQIAAPAQLTGGGKRAAVLTPVPPQPGDTNCDWAVGVDDLLNVINAWGPYQRSDGGGTGSPDLNADGSVNVDDLLIVINNWT